MTHEERRRKLQAIIDQQNVAEREFRESLETVAKTAQAMRTMRAAMADVEAEQQARIDIMTAAANKAIAAMLTANQQVRDLFADDD